MRRRMAWQSRIMFLRVASSSRPRPSRKRSSAETRRSAVRPRPGGGAWRRRKRKTTAEKEKSSAAAAALVPALAMAGDVVSCEAEHTAELGEAVETGRNARYRRGGRIWLLHTCPLYICTQVRGRGGMAGGPERLGLSE
jgi:hypothetical protein